MPKAKSPLTPAQVKELYRLASFCFRNQYLGRHVLHLRGWYGLLENLHLEQYLAHT